MTPDSVTDKLARFTADGSQVDPAEILFRAGRASARTPRMWKLAVAGLVLTNLVTAGFLGLYREQPQQTPEPLPIPVVIPVIVPRPEQPPSPEVSPSPWSLGALMRLTDPNDLPRSPVVTATTPERPLLTPRSHGEID